MPKALALLLAMVLAGCGGDSRDGRVTLEFWAFGREGEVVQELVPEFERRHPDLRVRVQQVPWTAAHEKLLTAFVGEATPDLAQVGNTWIPELAAIGALEPLDGRIAGSAAVQKADHFPGIWDTNVIDGVVYGIPWYVDTRLIFYRRDLLAAAGYTGVPQTWAEWRRMMDVIKERSGPQRFAIFLPTDEWQQPVAFGLQNGSPLLTADGGRGAFSEPAFREAFDFYLGLYHDGLAPEAGNNQIANVYQPFAAGDFALYITGPWNIGEFRRRLPPEMQDRWMTAPLPGPDGPGVALAGGSSLSIFQRSENQDAAWKLIEYLSAPEQQIRFYELSGDLPAHRHAWSDPSLANDPPLRAFWDQLQRVAPTPKVPEWEQIATKVYEHAETAIRGRATAAEALAALDRDVDRILEKRRFLLARQAEKEKEDEP